MLLLLHPVVKFLSSHSVCLLLASAPFQNFQQPGNQKKSLPFRDQTYALRKGVKNLSLVLEDNVKSRSPCPQESILLSFLTQLSVKQARRITM